MSSEGVCESVLFGLPLVARPTACWKLDWEDLVANQQHYTTLTKLLREKVREPCPSQRYGEGPFASHTHTVERVSIIEGGGGAIIYVLMSTHTSGCYVGLALWAWF